MKIKIVPQVFLTAGGNVRKYYVFITPENGKMKLYEFDTALEVDNFLKRLKDGK